MSDRLPPTPGGHDTAVSAPPYEMAAESVPSSVARFRRFATDSCRHAAPGIDGDTVALLVSEVVTNALVHGTGQVRVRVLPLGRGVRIEVHDGSAQPPALRRASPDDEGGRGIALVERLADRWGSEPLAEGKTVWFELSPV